MSPPYPFGLSGLVGVAPVPRGFSTYLKPRGRTPRGPLLCARCDGRAFTPARHRIGHGALLERTVRRSLFQVVSPALGRIVIRLSARQQGTPPTDIQC